MRHNFFELALVFAVASWVFDSMVNRRIDARLRAAGLPTPAKPKTNPGPWAAAGGLIIFGLCVLFAYAVEPKALPYAIAIGLVAMTVGNGYCERREKRAATAQAPTDPRGGLGLQPAQQPSHPE